MPREAKQPSAEEIVLYEKDVATKIATITLNRPDMLNAPSVASRIRFGELVHRANVDEDVKVLVIRGVGDHFGSGADLPEMAHMWDENSTISPLYEFNIPDDGSVKYPARGSYRHLASITQLYANSNFGLRSLQDFKKISIVESKGYNYGWHFYQCADADLVISSEEALFGHSAWRYVGWAARMWQWTTMMGVRKFMEMVFTGRPFTAKEMYEIGFVNSVVPRDQLEAETMKYALACSNTSPTDTIYIQKTFFEIFKQNQGEYMGSVLTGWLESMLPMVKQEGGLAVTKETFDSGLANAVKDNDSKFPPDWRMSYKARRAAEGHNTGGGDDTAALKAEVEALRKQLAALTEKMDKLVG